MLAGVQIVRFLGKLKYSASQKKRYEYCFMKQKCKIQMGIAHHENRATPLKTLGIITTTALSNEAYNFALVQGVQKLPAVEI